MFDGSSIEGFVRIEESDMFLKPDASTFQVFPWSYGGSERVGRLICDIANPDGTPFVGCPRSLLKGVLARARRLLGKDRLSRCREGDDDTPPGQLSAQRDGQLVTGQGHGWLPGRRRRRRSAAARSQVPSALRFLPLRPTARPGIRRTRPRSMAAPSAALSGARASRSARTKMSKGCCKRSEQFRRIRLIRFKAEEANYERV